MDVKWSRLLLGVDFGGERLVGLGGCSLDPALGCVEPGKARRLRHVLYLTLERDFSVRGLLTLTVACRYDHVLAHHLDAFAFPFARTVRFHVNADRLHETALVLARDLAYLVVLHLYTARADVLDAEAVGLTAQLGDYLAFGLLLRLHTYSPERTRRLLYEWESPLPGRSYLSNNRPEP